MKRHFAAYKPDTSPKQVHPLPGEEIKHGENTSIGRYVWMLIEWEGNKPVIHWQKEWKL